MVSVSNIDGDLVSSSLPTPIMLPIDFKSFKPEGLKKLRGNRSISETHRFLNHVLYSKAKDNSKPPSARSNFTFKECPPVEGREHLSVQTDIYLEELVDKIDEFDQECQTDLFLDKPMSPLFVPAKFGTDVATQIYPGDLFDFDREVQPFLESLVGQTVEQSLTEISAEDNIRNLEMKQKEFDTQRNAEIANYVRLEQQERRLLDEKRRRLKEYDESVQLENEMMKKVAACVFAQDYLSDLLPKVYRRLERQGYFIAQDPEIQQIEENFWPWLIDEVDTEIQTLQTSCNLIDALIEDSVQKIAQEAVVKPIPSIIHLKRDRKDRKDKEKMEEQILDDEGQSQIEKQSEREKQLQLEEQPEEQVEGEEQPKELQIEEEQSKGLQFEEGQPKELQIGEEQPKELQIGEEQPKELEVEKEQPEELQIGEEQSKELQSKEEEQMEDQLEGQPKKGE